MEAAAAEALLREDDETEAGFAVWNFNKLRGVVGLEWKGNILLFSA